MKPLTDDQCALVLASLAAGCSLADAAKGAGSKVDAVRSLVSRDDAFAEAFEAAMAEGRALPPVERPVAPVAPERRPTWGEVAKGSAVAHAPVVTAEPETTETAGKVPTMCGDDGLPDWDLIRATAEREHGPGPFGLLRWQEERLAARGYPRLHPWWLWTLERFFSSLKRWLLVYAGRGMGKSTLMERLAAVLATFTQRRIPPGQTWIWPYVSVRPSDAKNRISGIKELYAHGYHLALKMTSPEGTPTMPLNDTQGHSIAFVSFASTLGNVSGPNSIGATVDEEEKIERDTSEIIGSLIATFRARPSIRGIRCSSAMTVGGSLYRSIKEGDTITNFVATIGDRFLAEVLSGFAAVAEWEEAQKNQGGAAQVRAFAATLTGDSPLIPSWCGNLMDSPDAARRAVALRVEVEGIPPGKLDGLTRTRYFLREFASWPTGEDALDDDEEYDVCGDASRYYDETAGERDYR